MIVACDQNDRGISIAQGEDSKNIEVQECHSKEEAIIILRNVMGRAAGIVFTKDCSLLKEDLLPESVKRSQISRLEAFYCHFQQHVKEDECLILSIGLQSSVGGLVKEGRVVKQKLCGPDLTLRGIWQEFVNSNVSLKQAVGTYLRGKSLKEEEKIFQGFLAALGGNIVQNPIPFYPPIMLNSAIKPLKQVLTWLDPEGTRKSLILTDWAAFGTLPELLEKEGYTVYSSLGSSFQDAARGSVLWGLAQQEQSSDAEVEQLAKEIPLPPSLFQQGRTSLLRGEYEKAVKCFQELLQEDESNREIRALWLLAKIKQHKSIQDYLKEIDEVRNCEELRESEKPWMKEILVLAASEYLEQGDIESAEEDLEQAYKIDASGEVVDLLGRIKGAKGDQALRKGNLHKAMVFYDEAVNIAPHHQAYSKYRQQIRTVIENQRVKNRKLAWSFLAVTVIGVVIGLWLRGRGSYVSNDSSAENRLSKSQIKELQGNNDRLQRDLNTQKQELVSQLVDKDREIEKLKDLLQKTGQGNQQDQKEELERLRRALTEAQRARVEAEKELGKARETIVSLEERLRGRESPSLQPGRYEVVRQTSVRAEPNENARIISRINSGVRVRVVEVVNGYWLRIISVYGNPPGYIRRDDAVLLYPEPGGS